MSHPHEPTPETRKQVETMTGFGVPQADVAKLLGISKPTLDKHYRPELDTGMLKANVQVTQSLFQKAIGNGPAAVTAAIFWAKCRMGWRETPEELNVNMRVTDKTLEDRAKAMAALLAKRKFRDG